MQAGCAAVLAGFFWLVAGQQAAPETASLFPDTVARSLDAAIGHALSQHNLPSVAVGISVAGRSGYSFVAGAADLATAAPRSLDQPFRIASLTKTFTATAILLLIDRGRLRNIDPISTWFPDFPNAGEITVDDLLRMRSGIAAPSDEALMEQVYDDPVMAAPSLAELMQRSAALFARFKPPGREGVYSNLGYMILGGIVERVSGQALGDFVAENIVHPLSLDGTSFPRGDDLPGGLHGYGWDGATRVFQDRTAFNPALAGAAGAMISTIADLQTFVVALCTGTLLKPHTQRARMQAQPLDGTTTAYGEGVINSGGVCGHSGTIPGFNTDMYYLEKAKVAVVVSVNRLDRDDAPQTTPVLKLVLDALRTRFGAF